METLKNLLFVLILATTVFAKPCVAQEPDHIMRLPFEIHFKVKGVEAKLILKEMTVTPQGGIAELTIGFKNSQSGEWIYFEANDVTVSNNGGLHPPFDFVLRKECEGADMGFLNFIIQRKSSHKFVWNCGCDDELPKLPM